MKSMKSNKPATATDFSLHHFFMAVFRFCVLWQFIINFCLHCRVIFYFVLPLGQLLVVEYVGISKIAAEAIPQGTR